MSKQYAAFCAAAEFFVFSRRVTAQNKKQMESTFTGILLPEAQ
jgi:hypothetical protein